MIAHAVGMLLVLLRECRCDGWQSNCREICRPKFLLFTANLFVFVFEVLDEVN